MTELTAPAQLPIRLPDVLQNRLDALVRSMLTPDTGGFDFLAPSGESAFVAPQSMSWRIFKNPVSLYIGGVAAVILELAEPRVRTGVWEHTRFRTNPVGRMQRTGLAAMATVYGARSKAETMIAAVRRAHENVEGRTPAGEPYRASDPALLDYVQVTATYGFAMAYSTFVRRLRPAEIDAVFAEAREPARLYGALRPPATLAEASIRMQRMLPRLEPSDILFEFLDTVADAPILPAPLRPFQRLLVRAAISLTPPWAQEVLQIAPHGLRAGERLVVRQAGALADRVVLDSAPPVLACRRLGLPRSYLYGSVAAGA
jgi:uncharacterized protein (DUF2236 family)